ncbi:MAG: efflux RND transporter periplasmic adaptor subunit [Thermodesulfobacteriota bacterium]
MRIAPRDKETHPRGRSFYFIVLILLGLGTAAALVIYLRETSVPVSVMTVEQVLAGKEQTILNASGYVTPRRRATIAAKITGRLVEVLVDEGMHVAKGEVLARFDDADIVAAIKTLEAEVVAAEAAIAEIEVNRINARRNLERDIQLHRTGIITQKDLENTQTLRDSLDARRLLAGKQRDVSRTRLAQMQQELINYTVTAPFSGIVVSKDAQVGEIVSPVSAGGGFTRTGIATIVDMESLEIEVDINESFIAKVKNGQAVTAVLDAYPDWSIPAKVRTVIPTADRQKATVKVRIAFDKLDPRILPDMGVKVAFMDAPLESDSGGRNAVRIPLEAIRQEGDRHIVFIYKGGTVESRAVKTGTVTGTSVDILAGILPGEQVVAGNIAELADGDTVRPAER